MFGSEVYNNKQILINSYNHKTEQNRQETKNYEINFIRVKNINFELIIDILYFWSNSNTVENYIK